MALELFFEPPTPAGKDDLLFEAAKDFLLAALLLPNVLFDLA